MQEGVENSVGFVAVFGEDVTLLDSLGAFAAGERGLIEGDVADEIEGVEICADLGGELFEEDTLGGEFVDDGLFLGGVVPDAEEVIKGGEGLADGLAGEILEGSVMSLPSASMY